MVRTQSEMQSEIRRNMRDGRGEVEIVHVFRKEELKGRTRLFAKLRLGKDCSIGYHEHNDEEEIFYVTAGQGIVTENGKTYTVNTGDAILTGGGSGHAVENRSDAPLELLAVILLYT